MATSVAALGLGAGLLLVGLLLLDHLYRSLGIWPNGQGDWRGALFWSLFRTVNVTTLLLGWVDWQYGASGSATRLLAAAFGITGAFCYFATCTHLGRVNLYCGRAGLVTSGLYGWSRNPQYALAMPSYAALAVASASTFVALLAIVVSAIFLLMALNEEPWLERAYGDDYRAYKAEVPRFYNVKRFLRAMSRRSAMS